MAVNGERTLIRLTKTGKNIKPIYMAANYLRMVVPRGLYRRQLGRALAQLEKRSDKEYILNRVNYYNKLDRSTPLPDGASRIKDLKLKNERTAYYFDTMEYLRWFPSEQKFMYLFGDITEIPPHPAILKSRPIMGDNRNSVVMKLVKQRHYTFIRDCKPFRDKWDRAVFRGHIDARKPQRVKLMETCHGSELCDVAASAVNGDYPAEWLGNTLTMRAQLDYKFILTVEGHDVASNLKWVMSSNSVAVMPRPVYETWYMEGTLIPNHHYIEIKDDFSDLAEKLEYYSQHPEEAEQIVRNAQEYTRQFFDRKRERLISLLVLEKYFRMTGQE